MVDQTRLNADEHAIFVAGARHAQRFEHGSHLIHQDIFKAETSKHHLYIGYDDVEDGVSLTITFKNRWLKMDTALPYPRKAVMHFRSAGEALERALKFLAKHSVAEPYCTVD